MKLNYLLAVLVLTLFSCQQTSEKSAQTEEIKLTEAQQLLSKYITVKLEADLSHLDDNQRAMIKKLIKASEIMDDLYWYEAFGDKEKLLATINDPDLLTYIKINYGPWDRLDDNNPFIEGYGKKPATANFYPTDLTKEEFNAAELENKDSQYTFIRRNDDGELITIPYHVQFAEEVKEAATLLREASALAVDEGFKNYLSLRADALLNDEYKTSDLAWMDMKSNSIDVVIGPIENYEDELFNYKTAHEAYVLIKDMEWSDRLSRFTSFLPELQMGLPVEDAYKQDKIGTDADLNAYDVVYYSGNCNAGSKTIAINLPNDEEVQQMKGSRRLQLKNAMRAKFDQILLPIADVLIEDEQRNHITFDAFFANTMFHEVAHGLGVKNTINDKGTVRRSLEEHASAIEEGKADILGLYMVSQLHAKGEIEGELEDYLVTFMAGIFRSVRFGASSAHGKANMIRFNFFQEFGAFERNEETGKYRVNFEKMTEAMNALSAELLTLQGNGDYSGVDQLINEMGKIGSQLQIDLDRLSDANIPVDINFEQGIEVLGL